MANPLMNTIVKERSNDQSSYGYSPADATPRLTRASVSMASIFALSIVVLLAVGTYVLGMNNPGLASLLNLVGAGGVLVTSILSAFFQKNRSGSLLMTVILAVFEGLMAGGFTFTVGNAYVSGVPVSSLIMHALVGTAALFFAALFMYSSGIIKVNRKFRSVVAFAVTAMAVGYGINFVITLITGSNLLFADGPIPIIVGIVAIILGALSLISTFDSSDKLIEAGAPDKTKWSLASSIMVDVVWLYMEIFRVLSLLNRN